MKTICNSIFPVKFYQINIRENNDLKKNFLDNIIKSYTENNVSPPLGWSTNKIHTSFGSDYMNDYVFSKNDFPKDLYYSYINDYVMQDKWVGGITDFWYNCYIDGDYQEKHNHCNPSSASPHFSAVHYLSFDKKRHEPVTFCDPLGALRCLSVELEKINNPNQFCPEIDEGDLVIFPSYLDHFVKPSIKTPDYPRVTISFNFHIEMYGA